jgi:hypothetical protein
VLAGGTAVDHIQPVDMADKLAVVVVVVVVGLVTVNSIHPILQPKPLDLDFS